MYCLPAQIRTIRASGTICAACRFMAEIKKEEFSMHRRLSALAAFALAAAFAMPTLAVAQRANHTKVGTLTC
jgi:hypothetical protein